MNQIINTYYNLSKKMYEYTRVWSQQFPYKVLLTIMDLYEHICTRILNLLYNISHYGQIFVHIYYIWIWPHMTQYSRYYMFNYTRIWCCFPPKMYYKSILTIIKHYGTLFAHMYFLHMNTYDTIWLILLFLSPPYHWIWYNYGWISCYYYPWDVLYMPM